jgi:hypothetical protein
VKVFADLSEYAEIRADFFWRETEIPSDILRFEVVVASFQAAVEIVQDLALGLVVPVAYPRGG